MIGLEYSSLIRNSRMNEWQTCFGQLDRRLVFSFCLSLGYTPNRVVIAIMELLELGLGSHLMHTMRKSSKVLAWMAYSVPVFGLLQAS